MNFIELHIGDWVKRTKALPHVQRAIYMDLTLAYYTNERPFLNRQEAYDECGARTKALREHADVVLEKFYNEEADGRLSHDRCDEEIHRYKAKKPAADAKRENDKERQDRARARRRELFQELRKHGITAAYDATTAMLEEALRKVRSQPQELDLQGRWPEEREPVTAPVTRDTPSDAAPVTAPVTRDNTATSPQSPVPSNSLPERASSTTPAREGDPAEDARALQCKETAEQAAKAMAAVGLQDVNASDPVLLAQIAAGMTVPELEAAAIEAVRRGKGCGWALARAQGKRTDAAGVAAVAPIATAPTPDKDPVLVKLEQDARSAAPVPGFARALLARLKPSGGTTP